ncbi:MAG: hypothetical protein HZA78_12520 [Candidatus Schekmanbacteria bacterium]|nr:hypothetical protein [Candidatus Schekmanbacteria bacterium]
MSGLGVREGAFVVVFNRYNVIGEKALTLSLLLFSINTVIELIGRALELEEFFKAKRLPRYEVRKSGFFRTSYLVSRTSYLD